MKYVLLIATLLLGGCMAWDAFIEDPDTGPTLEEITAQYEAKEAPSFTDTAKEVTFGGKLWSILQSVMLAYGAGGLVAGPLTSRHWWRLLVKGLTAMKPGTGNGVWGVVSALLNTRRMLGGGRTEDAETALA